MSYLKIKSWHVFSGYTQTGVLTRCGRVVEGTEQVMSDTLPLDERSCESCLRLAAHDQPDGWTGAPVDDEAVDQ